jgi:hypothetical protein
MESISVPTYIIITLIIAVILDILGIILLLMETFDPDFY